MEHSDRAIAAHQQGDRDTAHQLLHALSQRADEPYGHKAQEYLATEFHPTSE
ncbi:MAG: hypothetical protein IGR92_05125 [Leptolyngbyaceae cyanobacterium T60_A2020_046]|nr:hypothetical protein [Leptolyngbyaceae cyanobacterium T60_A2020_046]